MRTTLLLALLAVAQAFAQAPPVQRNPFTTNDPPNSITNTVPLVQSNASLTITGTGPLTNEWGGVSTTQLIPGLIKSTNPTNGPLNVVAYDIIGDGVNDVSVDFQVMIDTWGPDMTYHLPRGTYLFNDQIDITHDRVHIQGDGAWTTTWRFAPSIGGKVAINYEDAGNIIWQGSVEGITFDCVEDATIAKTGIRIVDGSEFFLRDVIFNRWYGGNGSVCVETQGREMFRTYENCRFEGDIPLYINQNPNTAPAGYLSSDHFTFYDLYLSTTNQTKPKVLIADGVHLSSTTFFAGSWNGGSHGLYWNNPAALATSEGLNIIGTRTEQSFDPNSYSLYIAMPGLPGGIGANLQNLNCVNFTMDGAQNGIYLRNVVNPSFQKCSYPGDGEMLNLVGVPYSTTLDLLQAITLSGGGNEPTLTVLGMTEKFSPGKQVPTDTLPNTAFYGATTITNFVLRTGTNDIVVSGDDPVRISNAGAVSGRPLEALALRAMSWTNVNDQYGVRLGLYADNETNALELTSAIDGVWYDGDPAVRLGAINFVVRSGADENRVMSMQGDRLIKYGVGEIDATQMASAGGGAIILRGSTNNTAADRHAAVGTADGAGTFTEGFRAEIGGTNRFMNTVMMGHGGNPSPPLYFWPDTTGVSMYGTGDSLQFNMDIGSFGITNLSSAYFHFVDSSANGTNGLTLEASTSSYPGRIFNILDDSDVPLMVVTNDGGIYMKTGAFTPLIAGGNAIGTDTAGTNVVIQGGNSTGTGRGGAVVIQTAESDPSTGSGANLLTTRYYAAPKWVTLTESAATTIATISLPQGDALSVEAHITVTAGDATDRQEYSAKVLLGSVNKSGTITLDPAGAVTPFASVNPCSTGTLTAAITQAQSGDAVVIQVNAVSSLTQTFLRCRWQLAVNSSDVATVTPQ